MRRNYFLIKDIFDKFFAIIFLILTLPILIILSILILIKLGNPIFFIQERPGFRCKPFKLIKFRTMTNDIDTDGLSLPDSERITNFGFWLRSLSLDELPAFINILKGEMSLIGPRPLLMEYLPLYSKRQIKRHNVKPGFTGWAQINGRNSISWKKKFDLDLWYVENQNFFLDLRIFFITIIKVLKKTNINSPGESSGTIFKGNLKNN